MILEFGGQEGTNSHPSQQCKPIGGANACSSFYPCNSTRRGGTRKLAVLSAGALPTCCLFSLGNRAPLPTKSLGGSFSFPCIAEPPVGTPIGGTESDTRGLRGRARAQGTGLDRPVSCPPSRERERGRGRSHCSFTPTHRTRTRV